MSLILVNLLDYILQLYQKMKSLRALFEVSIHRSRRMVFTFKESCKIASSLEKVQLKTY